MMANVMANEEEFNQELAKLLLVINLSHPHCLNRARKP